MNRAITNYIDSLQQIYSRGITGKGVTAAVLDTGIFPHRDFLLPGNRIVGFRDFVHRRNHPYDDNGHGTHVCGILASAGRRPDGREIGMAPEASLVGVKVLDSQGSGRTEDMIRAIDWILTDGERYGIRIVNISVGMPVRNTDNPEADLLVQKVEELWDRGMIVVVAAGNEGPHRYTVTSPGVSRKVITVGALEERQHLIEGRGVGQRKYSGCGPVPGSCVCKPDVVAPADGILSCDNREGAYVKRSGTSMATPMVSGAIALLLSDQPWLTNLEVKIRLMESSRDCGGPGYRQGWGALDPKALIDIM